MKNLVFLILGWFITFSAIAQFPTNAGLVASLSSTEINSINTKVSKFKNLIVSNKYNHYYSRKHSKKNTHTNNLSSNKRLTSSDSRLTSLLSKDTNYSLKSNSIGSSDSTSNNDNNKCCMINYYLSNKGIYKYGVHVEGKVKDCEEKIAIPHAYVSINSAVVPGKYLIIPTTQEGKFNIDVVDDSIGSITVIKKGYTEKEIKLEEATVINENTSYAFDVCLNKEIIDSNKNKPNNEITASNILVYFGFNKSTLNKSMRNLLDSVIKNIKNSNIHPTSIDLNGYTDSKGSRKYNLELSRIRAIECRRYLVYHGLTHVKIRVHALGSKNPIESEVINHHDNPKARAQNRRVEIVLHND